MKSEGRLLPLPLHSRFEVLVELLLRLAAIALFGPLLQPLGKPVDFFVIGVQRYGVRQGLATQPANSKMRPHVDVNDTNRNSQLLDKIPAQVECGGRHGEGVLAVNHGPAACSFGIQISLRLLRWNGLYRHGAKFGNRLESRRCLRAFLGAAQRDINPRLSGKQQDIANEHMTDHGLLAIRASNHQQLRLRRSLEWLKCNRPLRVVTDFAALYLPGKRDGHRGSRLANPADLHRTLTLQHHVIREAAIQPQRLTVCE